MTVNVLKGHYMRNIFSKLNGIPPLFWIVSVIYFSAAYYAYSIISPVYMGAGGYDFDPSYAYLLNGLTLLYGNVPGHVDHPGTPLQVFCAIVIFLRWGLYRIAGSSSGEDILSDVLTNPEGYITTASGLLLVMNTFALIFLALRIFKVVGKMWAGIAILLMPFLFPILIPRSVYLSPEALLIFSSTCLLAILLPSIFQEKEAKAGSNSSVPMLSGILFGFGLAVKLTFLPMAVLLLLQGGARRVLTSILFACGSFILFISPVLPKFGYIINWTKAIAQHTGNYGGGATGVIDWAAIPERAINLFVIFPLAFFVTALLLITPIILRRLDSNGRRAIPWALSAVVLLQFALVLKHYGTHYMVPALPVSLVGAIWLIWAARVDFAKSILWRNIPVFLVCVGLVVGAYSTLNMMTALANSRALISEEYKKIRIALDLYPGALIICSYRCGLPQYAIAFGVGYTDGKLKQRARPFLDNFARLEDSIYLPNSDYSADKINELISHGKSVLFLSSNDAGWLKQFSKEPVVVLSGRTLYKVNKISLP